MLGAAHCRGGVRRHDLTDDQPVEQHPDRRQVLLDRGSLVGAAEQFDVGRDVVRAHRAERGDLLRVEPGEERARGDRVGGAGVRIADVRGEEIQEPQRGGFTLRRDQSRNQPAGRPRRGDDDRLGSDDERLAGFLRPF